MLECLKFIFNLILKFLYMLFDINVGFTSLGTLMCVTFIFLPMVLTIINFLKRIVIDEMDEKHDYGRFFNNKGSNKKEKKSKSKRSKKY